MPYNCDGRSCPLYAADIANPAFRSAWIQDTVAVALNANYPGLYIDDVNVVLAKESPDQGSRIAMDLRVPDACPEHEIAQSANRLEIIAENTGAVQMVPAD